MGVFVYFNLHKKLFSIKDIKTNRVIRHASKVYIKDALFKVSESGRQRVLKEKRKNVHAGVIGTLVDHSEDTVNQATYNPYLYDSFVDVDTKTKITNASFVLLEDKKIFYST